MLQSQFVGELRVLLPGDLKIQFSPTERCLPSSLPGAVFFRLVYRMIEDSEQNKGIIPELCLKWPLTALVLLIKIFVQPLQFLLR